MKEQLKSQIAAIQMDEAARNRIRRRIEAKTAARGRIFLGVAACLGLLLAFPGCRATVAQAAEQLYQKAFVTANGMRGSYEETERETRCAVEISDEYRYGLAGEGQLYTAEVTYEDGGYVRAEGGKLFFTHGGTRLDITEKCSTEACLRYELPHEDGGKSVILIAGTPAEYGWAELVFSADGDYLFNQLAIPQGLEGVFNAAMHREGVSTGDPALDFAGE